MECFQQAAPLFDKFAYRYREGLASAYLGDALRLSGQLPETIGYYQQALEIFREFKDRAQSGHLYRQPGPGLR